MMEFNFWLGMAIGLFTGGALGCITACLCVSARGQFVPGEEKEEVGF